MHNRDIRWLSQPVKLHWLGWEATTDQLVHNGWDISANQCIERQSMQISLRNNEHGQPIYGMSEIEDWHYDEIMGSRSSLRNTATFPLMTMRMAHNIAFNYMAEPSAYWDPVDARPSFTREEIRSMEDLCHFKKIPRNTQEIILPNELSMAEVLDVALSKQESSQAQIREQMIRHKELDEYRQNTELKAELRLVA